jgi:hypothetical protein
LIPPGGIAGPGHAKAHLDTAVEIRTMTDHDDREQADPGGLGHNPGPVGSARYEHDTPPAEIGGPDHDADGDLDTTRDDVKATEFGGAYGRDRPPVPTDAAWDRGEATPHSEER